MRQKLVLVLGLLKQREAVVLNEPTSGLDPAAALELSERLQPLASRGVAVLATTHDVLRAQRMVHRTLFMAPGRVVASPRTRGATKENLLAQYIAATGGEL